MPIAPIRVFLSYSHDSPEHMDAVLALANRLRKEGVDCWIDQYVRSPSEGWPIWCNNQIEDAKFVLVVCSEIYLRRFRGKEEPGTGKGVTFEGFIITQELYNAQGKNDRFVPIVLTAAGRAHIPILLQGASHYDVSTTEGYDEVYFGILGQPKIPLPELGPTRSRLNTPVLQDPLPKLASHRDFAARPFNVPIAPNPFFTGREDILKEVHKKLAASKRVALSGMRGVGKTRAAAEYVYAHRNEYQAIFWARAETRETLLGDLASIARLLNLPAKDEKDQSVIVVAVKSWLEANADWLLVCDNADDLALIEECIPAVHTGHLLLTTTAQALAKIAEKVRVEKMTVDEGVLLLLRRATVISKQSDLDAATRADCELAGKLVYELGGLPLALDQAGAFIEETPSTLAEYWAFYQKEGKRLRRERGEFRSQHPSVTVTFVMAFNELAKRDPAAADLVRLCAFLAADAIPEEIFTRGGAALGEEFARRAENPLDFSETLKQAAKFSLIQRDAADHALDIHRLVQEVLKDEMDEKQLREWAERAIRAVNCTFPVVEFGNWSACERLLPHAKACADLIEAFSIELTEAATLLNETALYMKERAIFGNVESLHRRSIAIYEKVLGEEHPSVATSLNNLASFFDDQGRYAEAEPLYLRALATFERALGPEHPYVATSLNNLATFFNSQGRYAEAEPLHQRALAIREKVLGAEHPGVAQSLNNLAMLFDSQGRHAEAEPLYKRALPIFERALGAEHPTLATSINNLAELFRNQGRYAEAEPLHQRALAIREKTLGPEHPDIAQSLNNLALLFAGQQKYAEAEPLFQRSRSILEKTVGPDHPNVAKTLENHAALLRKTERETEALPLEARAKAIRDKNLN